MTVGKLQFEGSPILRTKSNLVEIFDEELARLVRDMHHTIQICGGVGLAAPQVDIPKRIIIFNFEPLVMINPEIIKVEGNQTFKEGCLSFPNLFFDIERAKDITVRWQDVRGQYHIKEFTGLESTAIQHEVDHINGKLFVDYVNNRKLLLEKRK